MNSKSTTRPQSTAKPRPSVNSALRLLSRKSLTDGALRARLNDEGFDAAEIDAAVEQMRTWGYINDDRLGESVVAAAVRRKKGPAWLRQELSRRKVPHQIASRCLAELSSDALSLARDLLASRFGADKLQDSRTALRAMRLLQRRGFNGETIREALRGTLAEPPIDE